MIGEARFDASLAGLGTNGACGPGDAGADGHPVPRWITVRGDLTARELEQECRAHGVRLDRARRTYWQSERVFPQPERRLLTPPHGNGGARGYYRRGAIDLARVIDYIVTPGHPAKDRPWRCTIRELAPLIARWRTLVETAGGGEDAFDAWVAGLIPFVEHGEPIPGLDPRHRDVLPPGQRRIAPGERAAALQMTAGVAQAIADDWIGAHSAETPPDRLVVWFRIERSGPDGWRIADAGARRTSHEAQRARARG
jgi:hypothetical protein